MQQHLQILTFTRKGCIFLSTKSPLWPKRVFYCKWTGNLPRFQRRIQKKIEVPQPKPNVALQLLCLSLVYKIIRVRDSVRIIESLMLEKTSKIIQSNRLPIPTTTLSATSPWFLYTSRDGDSPTSLGSCAPASPFFLRRFFS